jgi:pepF/M3 family oligoendopeptidase
MKTLETARLILRDWQETDVSDLFAYARLDSVGPMAGWKPHSDPEESAKIVRMFQKDQDVWALELKSERKVIGSIGLHVCQSLSGTLERELGYVLSPDYQHRGLMTEACREVLRHAFEDLGLPSVRVSHFLRNEKSRRVIERLGFTSVGRQEVKTSGGFTEMAEYYRMTASEYEARKEKVSMYEWNLDPLYHGYEDPHFLADVRDLDFQIAKINASAAELTGYADKKARLERYLRQEIDFSTVLTRLYCYAALREATDARDVQTTKWMNLFSVKATEITKAETRFTQWLAAYPGLEEDLVASPLLREHEFHLREIIGQAQHTLDDKTEWLIAKLRQTGSEEWERLQQLLTSTLTVDFDGRKMPLSQVRNLAYEADPDLRKRAYLAELESYRSIEKSVCFALNNIKGEVNTLSALRGFPSALDEALFKSRMKRETLQALLDVATEYLPMFRRYLRRKGEMLGHPNGLPFYDLFAPMGKTTHLFSVPEAADYVLKNFKTFSDRLFEMAQRAFSDGWIDFLPKEGKVGGAFCENIHPIRESRILTNFTGVFGDVITLAHELGHAYHGECIFGESILNGNYTMPVAETASTFCETIVNKAALRDAADDQERIALLESSIQDYTQVIVDILSRFHFEQAIFEGRKETVFDENELKEMMLDAQRKTYGDGLDPDALHPYMWLCKGHYYSGTLSFYKFPYAFGLLFAKGLYAQYLKDPKGFPERYDRLLAATGKSTVEDTAKMAGIDVTDRDFWVGSLELIRQDIDAFMKLTE